jgi:pyruvate dehydrogenase E1 component alpha subunit
VHQKSAEAIEKARQGGGPTLIECKTYRWYGHSEIDPADYRTNEELDEWKKKDPIKKAEEVLMDMKLLDTTKREAIYERITQEIDDAISSVDKDEYAEPEEAYLDVYSERFPVRRVDW